MCKMMLEAYCIGAPSSIGSTLDIDVQVFLVTYITGQLDPLAHLARLEEQQDVRPLNKRELRAWALAPRRVDWPWSQIE